MTSEGAMLFFRAINDVKLFSNPCNFDMEGIANINMELIYQNSPPNLDELVLKICYNITEKNATCIQHVYIFIFCNNLILSFAFFHLLYIVHCLIDVLFYLLGKTIFAWTFKQKLFEFYK